MNNGVFGFILCAMNATLIASKTKNRRLNRIQIASLIFRVLNGIGFLLTAYCAPAFLLGWPPPYHDKLRIVIESHIYTSSVEVPPEVLDLWLVKMGLLMACMAVFDRLFRLYGKGILFSAKNINFIRFLGYYLILDWVVDYQMQGALHDMVLSTSQLYIGFLIIFFAWIMDEGRKIQEEQELTV